MIKKTSTEKTSFVSSPKPEVKKEVKVESPKVRPGSFAALISQ
jgi:hypothetical protein